MSGTGVERDIRRTRVFRAAVAFAFVVNAFAFAVFMAAIGPPLALVPAAAMIACLVMIVVQTRLIGTLERTQELNRHAGRLELAAKVLGSASCAHANAEPVNLFNPSTGERDGERVAWVCPDCNADLPAEWTPAKKVLRAGGVQVAAAELSGTGSLPAKPAWDDVAYASEASQHFAGLAKVGLKRCLSYCPICATRDEWEAPGGPALDFLRWHEARMRAVILAPKPDLGDGRGDLARDMRDLADLQRISASRPAPWCQEHACAVTDCPPFPDLPPDESEQ